MSPFGSYWDLCPLNCLSRGPAAFISLPGTSGSRKIHDGHVERIITVGTVPVHQTALISDITWIWTAPIKTLLWKRCSDITYNTVHFSFFNKFIHDNLSLCLINKTRLLWAALCHNPSIWDDFEQLYAAVVEHCHQGWLQFGDFDGNVSGGNSERMDRIPSSDSAVYLHNVCLAVRWSRIWWQSETKLQNMCWTEFVKAYTSPNWHLICHLFSTGDNNGVVLIGPVLPNNNKDRKLFT